MAEFNPFPKLSRWSRGIVIYHTASGTQFKKTIKKDESPKGLAA